MGIISVTLGKLGKKPEMMGHGSPFGDDSESRDSEASGADEGMPSEAFLSAANDVYDAAKRGDKEEFAAALKDAIEICHREYEASDHESDSSSDSGDKGSDEGV